MQTFLEICQDVLSELGIQGSLASVETAVGYQDRLCKAISRRWRTLQSSREDWRFLRTSLTHAIVAATQSYTLTTILGAGHRFGRWDRDNILFTEANGTRTPLTFVDYDRWIRENYTTAVGTPRKFSIQPWDNALLTENLSTNQNITLTYYKSPQILANDDDEIECPQMHEGVLFWYGVWAGAKLFEMASAAADAKMEYEKELGSLMRTQIPSRTIITRAIA